MGKKQVLRQGPISPEFIAGSIAKHQVKTQIGAHDIFLGQVRRDEIDGKLVDRIEYSAYNEMAEDIFHEIREEAFEKFDLVCMHIYHSLGEVKAGEICLFVFASAKHRKAVFEAIEYLVESIKLRVPIFAKEILEDNSFVWKENHYD